MRKKILIVVAIFVVFAASCLSVLKRHRSESVEFSEMEFSIPYIKAVFSLARKESMEKIVASGGGKLVSSNWDEFKFDLGNIPKISSWRIRAKGKLVVDGESEDFVGRISIIQDLTADKEKIISINRIDGIFGCLKEYSSELKITKGKKTKFRFESKIVYERLVPFWMCGKIDNLLREHNRRKVSSTMSAVSEIMGQR